jgi:protein involved in polysaccharide export with SLBB domain
VSDQQLQQYLSQPGLGDQIRQRIQQSGMTPDQIRARLRSAGYPENLIDQYLGQAAPGQPASPPSITVLQAASALGLGDFVATHDTLGRRLDSLRLSRGDSLLLDSLGLRIGTDSIPAKRDSVGFLVLDSAASFRLADRLRRPRLFGLDVFRRTTTQFQPVLTGPVDSAYRLGPGDDLVLIVTGATEIAHELPVTREGFVVIPQVGQIYVANVTLGQLREILYDRLGRVYAGVRRGPGATTQFQVAVSRVRMNQVYVIGEVARPGAYEVSGLATVMNALYQAGGPTERGDFREVRITRAGRVLQTLDLYEYLLKGSAAGDIRLEQGDVVFVPAAERRVTVIGSVVRAGVYELRPGDDLRALVRMAGGLLPDAYVRRAQIERVLPPAQRAPDGHDRTVLDVELASALDDTQRPVVLEADDRVTVFAVTRTVRNTVTIRGNVFHPGTYELAAGMRLSDLVRAAGGIKRDTYEHAAHILRLQPDSTRRLLQVDLARALRGEVAGGAGTDSAPPGAADPGLQEFDEVTVYSATDFRPQRQVWVWGSVQKPGPYVYRDSMTLRDVLMLSGGLRDEAYLLQAEISRNPAEPGSDTLAKVLDVPLDSSYVLDPTNPLERRTSAPAASPPLAPYDNIFVRRLPGFTLQRNVVIAGEVRFAGRYTITRTDERLYDLIDRAGGFTAAAYVRGAQFYRAENRAGRVGIDLERVMKEPGYRDNLILLAGDSLYVPLYQPVVQVEGAVNSPVAVSYVPNRSGSYYVDRARGYARNADKGRTYVVQPNGAVVRRGDTVEPGARVVVPAIPPGEEKTNWVAILSAVTTVLTSAVTLIVLIKR